MGVRIKDATTVLPLWDSSAPPTTAAHTGGAAPVPPGGVRVQAGGQFLCITVDKHAAAVETAAPHLTKPTAGGACRGWHGNGGRVGATSGAAAVVKQFVFDPIHHTRAALGLSDGTVYGVDLMAGQVFLLGDVTPADITALTFAAGPLSHWLLCSTTAGDGVAMDWLTGKRVQSWPLGTWHQAAVERILVDVASTSARIACQSSDSVSCWSLRGGGGQPGVRPSYVLEAFTPSLGSQLPHLEASAGDGTREDDHGIDAAVIASGGLITAERGSYLTRWQLPTGGKTTQEMEAVQGAGESCTSPPGAMQRQLTVRSPFTFSCMTAVPTGTGFLVVAETDAKGAAADGAVRLAVLDAVTLQGLHRLHLPWTGGSARRSISRGACLSIATTAVAVTGADTPQALLAMSFANGAAAVIELWSGQRVVEWEEQGEAPAERLVLAPTTFGAFAGPRRVRLVHLLTATQYHRQLLQACGLGEEEEGLAWARRLCCTPVGLHRVAPADLTNSRGRRHGGSPSLSAPPASHQLPWPTTASGGIAQSSMYGGPTPHAALYRSLATTISTRPLLQLQDRYLTQWVDATHLDMAGEGAHAVGGPHPLFSEGETLMPLAACRAYAEKMHKLREHLIRYGSFPAVHRPHVWRFAVGLPSLARTAPLYAALARKPPHHCAPVLLEGYPLPPTQSTIRTRMETVLSVMAWHAAPFGTLQCLPAIVFPFANVVEDPQSLVELLLLVFLNWGKDFFSYHPQAPPNVMTFIAQLLRREDPQLFQHLECIGSPVEVWGWEPLQVFYTDALTASEWLQVMDHTLCMMPLWLFVFHVCYLKARRYTLLACSTSLEVLQALQVSDHPPLPTATGFSIAAVIQETYRVCEHRHLFPPALTAGNTEEGVEIAVVAEPETPSSHPAPRPGIAVPTSYTRFVSLYAGPAQDSDDLRYPDSYKCDAEVLQERTREMCRRSQRLREAREVQLRQAAEERQAQRDALQREHMLQQAHTALYAKVDAAAEAFQSKVQLGKIRQHMPRDARPGGSAAAQVSSASPVPLAAVPDTYSPNWAAASGSGLLAQASSSHAIGGGELTGYRLPKESSGAATLHTLPGRHRSAEPPLYQFTPTEMQVQLLERYAGREHP